MPTPVTATLTYRCVEDGEEQTAVLTVTRDGERGEIKFEFEPGASDDTSDPCGLLVTLIEVRTQMLENFADVDES